VHVEAFEEMIAVFDEPPSANFTLQTPSPQKAPAPAFAQSSSFLHAIQFVFVPADGTGLLHATTDNKTANTAAMPA
jgi:hypothetical protein